MKPSHGSHRSARRRGVGVRAAAALVATLAGLAGVGVASVGGAAAAPPVWHAPDAAARAVLLAAQTHLGDRYRWGATGPRRWDCSGLTSTLWREQGGVAAIPRVAAGQQAWAVPVPAADVLPGDLVFFGRPAYHVGLALGSGWMIDASASHHAVVERQIWTTDVTYGRVPRPGMPPVRGGHRPVVTPVREPDPAAPPPARRGSRHGRPSWAQVRARFARLAAAQQGAQWQRNGTGHPGFDDLGLVRVAWHAAEGAWLPDSKDQVEWLAHPVQPWQLRPGDLVVYGAPFDHVGVYLGDGWMADASRSHGLVLVRQVFGAATLWFGRLS